jgi:hypothetical protein
MVSYIHMHGLTSDTTITAFRLQEYVKLFKFSAAKGDYWKTIPAPTNCIRAVAYKVSQILPVRAA